MCKKKILIVDDVKLNHVTARDVLEDEYIILDAYSANEGFEILKTEIPNLILLDVIMPGMNGIEMLQKLGENPTYQKIPVIFLSANTSAEVEVEGFDLGIVDYITKPFVPPVLKRRVAMQIELAEYRQNLEKKVSEKIEEMEKMYDLITLSFAGLVESRDGVTGGHLKNTSIYFSAFIGCLKSLPAYRSQLPASLVRKACRCAPLHDVGKIAIKDAVLQKPSSLSSEEFDEMKQHAIIGGEIFTALKEDIPDKEFAEVAGNIARYHHERWDGNGYPDGLSGEDIPLVARIMSIVDVYDALTSNRPYKEAFSHEKAMGLIAAGSGTQFDPKLVEHFLENSNVIKECLQMKANMRPLLQ